MKKYALFACVLSLVTFAVDADLTRLIPESAISAIAEETSGVSAKRNLDTITLYHRTRASSQFRQAADHVLMRLHEYGFDNAEILEYPANGKTLFGTQKSRLAWDVEFAELWELDSSGERVERHGSWEAMPLSLAQDSRLGEVQRPQWSISAPARLDEDYAGKDNQRKAGTDQQPARGRGRTCRG